MDLDSNFSKFLREHGNYRWWGGEGEKKEKANVESHQFDPSMAPEGRLLLVEDVIFQFKLTLFFSCHYIH